MRSQILRALLCALITVVCSRVSARSDESTKEMCLDSHSRGQDAREQGKISLAHKLFMSCAQAGCPSLVQSDCARFADELEHVQPSLSFVARDAHGNDLPDTAVYVDEALVVTRLDDGRAHDVDPGKHVVRFESAGRTEEVTIVVGSGEKGRMVVGTFPGAPGSADEAPATVPLEDEPKVTHALGARLLLGAGAVIAAGGLSLAIVGLTSMPSNCSLSSHQCAAPPGDGSFDDASKSVRLGNIGYSIGALGLAATVAGLVWFYKSKKTEGSEKQLVAAPWAAPSAAGFTLRARL
jgi:hypothetical protein